MTTPLTPMAEWIDRQSNTPWSPGFSEDFRKGYDTAVEEASAAYDAEMIDRQRERRERVDPDAEAERESAYSHGYGDGLAARERVDPDLRALADEIAKDWNGRTDLRDFAEYLDTHRDYVTLSDIEAWIAERLAATPDHAAVAAPSDNEEREGTTDPDGTYHPTAEDYAMGNMAAGHEHWDDR